MSRESGTEPSPHDSRLTTHDSPGDHRQKLLLVGLGDERRMAIPLALVSRLEEFSASSLEQAEGHHVVQYRGRLLPLISLGDLVGVHASEAVAHEDLVRVVVCSVQGRRIGFVVHRILGIAEDAIPEESSSRHSGILCTRVIQQAVTEVLDIGRLVQLADVPLFDLPTPIATGV